MIGYDEKSQSSCHGSKFQRFDFEEECPTGIVVEKAFFCEKTWKAIAMAILAVEGIEIITITIIPARRRLEDIGLAFNMYSDSDLI